MTTADVVQTDQQFIVMALLRAYYHANKEAVDAQLEEIGRNIAALRLSMLESDYFEQFVGDVQEEDE